MDTVSALLLGAISNRRPETDERGLGLFAASRCNRVVNPIKVAIMTC